MTVEPQPKVPGHAGVDDPPPFPFGRPGVESRVQLSVDENEFTLPAEHLFHWGDAGDVPQRVQGDVRDHEHAFLGNLDGVGVLDNDRPVETAEDLVGDETVVVGVVPVRARRVIGRQVVVVVEGCTRFDHHERIVAVALGGDVQAVHVQVRGVVKAVVEGHAEPVTWLQPEGWPWRASVVAQGVGAATADLCRAPGRVQAKLQSPVRAA